jgi:hypothetical protein
MCDFCESKETIKGHPGKLFNDDSVLSLKVDEESRLLKVRVEKNSAGYTFPISINFCMFCGDKINAFSE